MDEEHATPPEDNARWQLEALDRQRMEGERRNTSGHLRLNFLGAMMIGLLVLYGGAMATPLGLPQWGPVVSIAVALAAFIMLLWTSRPYLSWQEIFKHLFALPKTGPDYGAALRAVQDMTEEQIRVGVGRDVDFYNWGIKRREIQYVRCVLLLASSLLPLLVSYFVSR